VDEVEDRPERNVERPEERGEGRRVQHDRDDPVERVPRARHGPAQDNLALRRAAGQERTDVETLAAASMKAEEGFCIYRPVALVARRARCPDPPIRTEHRQALHMRKLGRQELQFLPCHAHDRRRAPVGHPADPLHVDQQEIGGFHHPGRLIRGEACKGTRRVHAVADGAPVGPPSDCREKNRHDQQENAAEQSLNGRHGPAGRTRDRSLHRLLTVISEPAHR